MPQYKHSGWKLVPHKAFKRTDPAILATLKPMPELQREDYKEYLREMNIPYEFWWHYLITSLLAFNHFFFLEKGVKLICTNLVADHRLWLRTEQVVLIFLWPCLHKHILPGSVPDLLLKHSWHIVTWLRHNSACLLPDLVSAVIFHPRVSFKIGLDHVLPQTPFNLQIPRIFI